MIQLRCTIVLPEHPLIDLYASVSQVRLELCESNNLKTAGLQGMIKYFASGNRFYRGKSWINCNRRWPYWNLQVGKHYCAKWNKKVVKYTHIIIDQSLISLSDHIIASAVSTIGVRRLYRRSSSLTQPQWQQLVSVNHRMTDVRVRTCSPGVIVQTGDNIRRRSSGCQFQWQLLFYR